ncbi:hypothetical protein JHK85_032111 [Glycine max]|nr:hypothetical protein JHK85_032111 [Glycine max]
MREAACLDLMDQYQVGRPPAKLHQGCLSHTKLRLARPYVCSAGNCQACYRRKDHLTCHLLQHQGKVFKCPVESCNTEFSLQSNMKGRVEETHEDSSTSTSDKSYKQHACPETGCGKRRIFEKADEEFRSRPRGGRKRKCPTVEMLVRKRVNPLSQLESWWLCMQDSDQGVGNLNTTKHLIRSDLDVISKVLQSQKCNELRHPPSEIAISYNPPHTTPKDEYVALHLHVFHSQDFSAILKSS